MQKCEHCLDHLLPPPPPNFPARRKFPDRLKFRGGGSNSPSPLLRRHWLSQCLLEYSLYSVIIMTSVVVTLAAFRLTYLLADLRCCRDHRHYCCHCFVGITVNHY